MRRLDLLLIAGLAAGLPAGCGKGPPAATPQAAQGLQRPVSSGDSGQAAARPEPKGLPPIDSGTRWDLEVADTAGVVTRVEQGCFRSSIGTYVLSGTRYRYVYEGLPVKFGNSSAVVKWDLIKEAEIALVRGDTPVTAEEAIKERPDLPPETRFVERRVMLTLKSGEVKRASLDLMDEFRGKTASGEFTLQPMGLKRIVVIGPSKPGY